MSFIDLIRKCKPIRKVYKFIRNKYLHVKFIFISIFSDTKFLKFYCNICGKVSNSPYPIIYQREISSCYYCGSSLRGRSIIHLLSVDLYGKSLSIPEFPKTNLVGIGMSDMNTYAIPLSKVLKYTNTFLHKEPKLDITSITSNIKESYDFIICSDVFEHVKPPIQIAFDNLYALLKPGGICIFTVPYKDSGETIEHFPNLHNYRFKKIDGKQVLHNKIKNGTEEIYDKIVFHGGEGSLLEMRLFSKPSLIENLLKAGFKNIKVYDYNQPGKGIIFNTKYSLPLLLKRPK